MRTVRGIPDAIPGERVLLTVPPLAPYVEAGLAADLEEPVRKRLNLFAQRALTHVALTDEQRSRIANAKLLARSVAPGVVDGLEVALEGAGEATALVLMPGHAIAPDGSDIELAYPLRVPYRQLPVFAPQIDARLRQAIEAAGRDYARLSPLEKLVTIERLAGAELKGLDLLPHAMVLVAMPRSVAVDRTGELDTPCPNATDERQFSEIMWEDGFLLGWVPWPRDASLPPWTMDGGANVDTRFRNRLAYAIFNNERERATPSALRSMRAWNERSRLSEEDKAALALMELRTRARAWPWETLGVPLALVGFDRDHRPAFSDRGAVVRQGGGRRNRIALVPHSGEDTLWQARVAQLVEHLAEIPPEARTADKIARQFDWLPPAGVLPREAADLLAGRQFVFPANFDVQVQPVPLDMADALIAESAALLPFNLSLRDQVQLLVPVAARHYEPNLLKLDEKIHPLFEREIARLERARLHVLARRDALRRRFDVLGKAATGQLPSYPQDDPNALPDESGALDAASFSRVHISAAAAGAVEEHGFLDARSRLTLQAADALFVFVRIDTPPPAISIELDVTGATVLPLVWGAKPPAGTAQWMGELPAAGTWTRLTVPLADLKLQSATLTGMRFGLAAGTQASRVTWGYAGKLNNGFESYWLSDAIPSGASAQATGLNPWVWEMQSDTLQDLDDVRFGLPLTGTPNPQDVREVAEIDNLVSAYLRSPGGLVRELGVAWPVVDRNGTKLDTDGNPIPPSTKTQHVEPSDQPPLIEQGLDAFIARMNARIAAANDHVEFGFLRARTDIFRVRQGVLGTDKAGQLLTSPAASELITRSASIAATEREFDDYFARAKEKPVAKPAAPSAPTTPTAPSSTTSGTSGATFSAAGTISTASTTFSTAPLFTRTAILTAPLVTAPAITAPVTTAPTATTIASPALVKASLALPTVTASPTVGDVVGSSLFATTFNTVTVGKRLEGSAAVETKNAAATGKTGFVTNSLKLLQGTGVSLHGIDVYGFKDKDVAGEPDSTKTITATAAIKLLNTGKLVDFDAVDPGTDDQHEAGYFKRGLEAIDSMVRFLRGVELRAEDYRRMQGDATAARGRIVQVMQTLQSMIDGLAAQLAEIRHDLSVARSLRAEEQRRIDALIARRKTILAEHVPYLLFRRPRFANVLVDAKVMPAQPAMVEDPVPRCREQHSDLPPELQAMVDTLKDVPARWFKRTLPIFASLDRVEHLQRVVEVARERVTAPPPARQIALVEGGGTKTGVALAGAFVRHETRIAGAQQAGLKQLTQLNAASLKQAIAPVRAFAALGDLIKAAPPARDPTLSAVGLLDDVAGVAACLYTAFGQVPPATRLLWAERFSQLDPSFSLRSLTVLPDFGNEALGVDYIAWRGMQSMVDWLFSAVEDEDEPVAAINDLVRVCLLLAAHAPTRRIVSARVKRPVKADLGAPLDLDIDTRVARVGMQVLVHAPATGKVVARAVLDDIAGDGARARITDVLAPAVTIDSSVRVQLQTGPALSTPAKQAADARQAVAAKPAPSPRPPSGIEAQAERRIGKQVEALAGYKSVVKMF